MPEKNSKLPTVHERKLLKASETQSQAPCLSRLCTWPAELSTEVKAELLKRLVGRSFHQIMKHDPKLLEAIEDAMVPGAGIGL